jgi:hypothetical protein
MDLDLTPRSIQCTIQMSENRRESFQAAWAMAAARWMATTVMSSD